MQGYTHSTAAASVAGGFAALGAPLGMSAATTFATTMGAAATGTIVKTVTEYQNEERKAVQFHELKAKHEQELAAQQEAQRKALKRERKEREKTLKAKEDAYQKAIGREQDRSKVQQDEAIRLYQGVVYAKKTGNPGVLDFALIQWKEFAKTNPDIVKKLGL